MAMMNENTITKYYPNRIVETVPGVSATEILVAGKWIDVGLIQLSSFLTGVDDTIRGLIRYHGIDVGHSIDKNIFNRKHITVQDYDDMEKSYEYFRNTNYSLLFFRPNVTGLPAGVNLTVREEHGNNISDTVRYRIMIEKNNKGIAVFSVEPQTPIQISGTWKIKNKLLSQIISLIKQTYPEMIAYIDGNGSYQLEQALISKKIER